MTPSCRHRLCRSIRQVDTADAKALRSVKREFTELSAIDFFPGEAQRQVEAALLAEASRLFANRYTHHTQEPSHD